MSPSQNRAHSYIQRVDDLKSHTATSANTAGRSVPSSNSGKGDNVSPQSSIQTVRGEAYPTRSDSLVPAECYASDRNDKTIQVSTSGSNEDASNHFNTGSSATLTRSTVQTLHDRTAADDEVGTPIQTSVTNAVHSSPRSEKQTSLQQHHDYQVESLRDATGPTSRRQPSPTGPLSLPKSRFSIREAESDNDRLSSETERPMSQQSGLGRYSGHSNRTFHTAENDSQDRSGSIRAEDDVETPKAEQSPQLTSEDVQDQLRVVSPPPADMGEGPRDLDVVSDQVSQPTSPSPMQARLPREPSLDDVPNIVHFDQPPSPVSPQRSFIHEQARPDNRKGPVYYTPSHDFGPTPNNTMPATAQDSTRHHSRGASLEDHPAFRRVTSPAQQSQTSAEQYLQARPRDDAPRQQQPDVDSNPSSQATSQNQFDEFATDAKRKSRNSGFFKAFKSPVMGGDQANREIEQVRTTPARVSVDGPKRTQRNSFFGPRNVDNRNDSGHSEGRSPAPIPPVDTMQQQMPAMQHSKGNSSPSSGSSNNLRNRLQRASTSSKKESDNGKKKRFSALGSLFGSRSRKTQPSTPEPSRSQQQPMTFYQFGPPQQSQAGEQQFQQRQQHPPHPDNRPSFQPSSRQSSSAQPRHDLVLEGPGQRPHEEYYAPVRSDYNMPQGSTPTWSHTAQKVSQATQPSTKEPPAYAQDAALRHRSTAPPEAPNPGASRASSTIPKSMTSDSPSTKSRSSIWSRSKSRELPFSKRHDRSTSGNSWTGTAQESSRQHSHVNPTNPQWQHGVVPPPDTGLTHSYQGRVLTYSQFGNSHIAYPPAQQAASIAQGGPHQPPPGRPQPQNIVTFNQFPHKQGADQGSPIPPPPPPKDDWHVSRPRQTIVPQASIPQTVHEQQFLQNAGSNYLQQPSRDHQSNTTFHAPRSSYPQQATSGHQQPQISQPRTHTDQPLPSHSRTASHSSQSQRQSLPPIQTEVPSNARSSNFSPEKTSAESRKARQRELEMGGPPRSANSSVPTETATAPVRKEDSEERIVMSSSSYPGMEWTPDRWEDD